MVEVLCFESEEIVAVRYYIALEDSVAHFWNVGVLLSTLVLVVLVDKVIITCSKLVLFSLLSIFSIVITSVDQLLFHAPPCLLLIEDRAATPEVLEIWRLSTSCLSLAKLSAILCSRWDVSSSVVFVLLETGG